MKFILLILIVLVCNVPLNNQIPKDMTPYAYIKVKLKISRDNLKSLGENDFTLLQLAEYDTNFILKDGKIQKINRLFKRFDVDTSWAFQKDSTELIKFYPRFKTNKNSYDGDTVFFMIYYPDYESIYTYIIFKQGDTFMKQFKPKFLQLR